VIFRVLKKEYFQCFSETKYEDNSAINTKLASSPSMARSYITFIFLCVGFSIFSIYSIDMLFNNVAAKHYPNPAALASFFGVFYAIVNIVQMVLSLCVTRSLLKKFGVIVGLLIYPLISLLTAITALYCHWIAFNSIWVFFLVLFLQLHVVSYNAAVRSPSILVLYQPLCGSDRSWLQSKVETLISPLATGMIGLFMLLMAKQWGVSPYSFLPMIIIFNLLIVYLTLNLKKGYLEALNKAILKHYLIQPNLSLGDKEILQLLKNKLTSAYPAEVVFALTTLEKMREDSYLNELDKALISPHPRVQQYALLQTMHYFQPIFLEKIRLYTHEDFPDYIRIAAYQALAANGNDEDKKYYRVTNAIFTIYTIFIIITASSFAGNRLSSR
jgi:hypothetical protein